MKTRNRLFAVLLALLILTGVLPVTAFAENDTPASGKIETKMLMLTEGCTVFDPSETVTCFIAPVVEDEEGTALPLPENTVKEDDLTVSPQGTLTMLDIGAVVEIPASVLGTGTHTLSAGWKGDDTYAGCSATLTITVAKKKSLRLTGFGPSFTRPGEPYTIRGRILDKNNDPVSGETIELRTQQEPGSGSMLPWYTETDSDGRFSYTMTQNLSFFQDGDTQDVRVIVPASDTHLRLQRDFRIRFETRKHDTTISVYVPGGLTLGQNESCDIDFRLYDIDDNYVDMSGAAGVLSLTENGSTITGVKITEELVGRTPYYRLTIPGRALSRGDHSLQLYYAGDSSYNPCVSSTMKLKVIPKTQQQVLDFQPDVSAALSACTVSGRLVKKNDHTQPVANKVITFYVGTEAALTTTTDSEGNFSGIIDSKYVGKIQLDLKLVSEEDGNWAKLEEDLTVRLVDRIRTVTFWDGETKLFTRNVGEGDKLTNVPDPNEKEGYWFDCWCSDPDLKNEIDWENKSFGSDESVYARWLKLYPVTIDMNGGTFDEKDTIDREFPMGYGEWLPNFEDMEGQHLKSGWVTAPQGKEYYGAEAYGKYYAPGSFFTVEGAGTLKILWRPEGTHTLFLKTSPEGAGTVTGAGHYAQGSKVICAAIPAEGYVFDGWYEEGAASPVSNMKNYPFTMPGSDYSLTARFKKTTNISSVTDPDRDFCYDDELYKMDFIIFDEAANRQALVPESSISVSIDFNPESFVAPMTGEGNCSVILNDPRYRLATGEHIVNIEFLGTDTFAPCGYLMSFTVRSYLMRPTGIRLNDGRAKKEYLKGEDLDVTGLELEVTRKGGSTDTVSVTESMVSGFDSKTPGEQTLTVTYEGFTDTYKVLVKQTHTVTVKADPLEGGTVTGGGSYADGKSATVKAIANPGYEFGGWYATEGQPGTRGSKNGIGGIPVSWDEEYTISSVTQDIDLTAKFIKVWKVTMDMNGGTFLSPASLTMQTSITRMFEDRRREDIPDKDTMDKWLQEGTRITAPADSEYIGAEITDASGTKTYSPGASYTVTGDAVVKVLWKSTVTPPARHTISYDLNGGTLNGKTGIVTIVAENGATITLPAPTREGYLFDYWEGSRYNAGDRYTVKGDHTLTARWKKEGGPITGRDYYPVTWDPNGGTLNASAYPYLKSAKSFLQPAYKGTEIGILAAPQREGYRFLYWECDGKRYKPGQIYTVTERDRVFTARWEKNSPAAPDEDDPGRTSPQTGDRFDPALYGGLLFLSAAAVALFVYRKRRARR